MADLAIVSVEINSSGAQRGARQVVSILKQLQHEFDQVKRAANQVNAHLNSLGGGTSRVTQSFNQGRSA